MILSGDWGGGGPRIIAGQNCLRQKVMGDSERRLGGGGSKDHSWPELSPTEGDG